MGKVIIFGVIVAIVIAAIAVGIVVIGGAGKIASLFWRKKPVKPEEERSADQIESDQWLADRYNAVDQRMRDDRRP